MREPQDPDCRRRPAHLKTRRSVSFLGSSIGWSFLTTRHQPRKPRISQVDAKGSQDRRQRPFWQTAGVAVGLCHLVCQALDGYWGRVRAVLTVPTLAEEVRPERHASANRDRECAEQRIGTMNVIRFSDRLLLWGGPGIAFHFLVFLQQLEKAGTYLLVGDPEFLFLRVGSIVVPV